MLKVEIRNSVVFTWADRNECWWLFSKYQEAHRYPSLRLKDKLPPSCLSYFSHWAPLTKSPKQMWNAKTPVLYGFGLILLCISNILQVFDVAHIKSLQVALHRLLKHQDWLKMNIKTVAVCAQRIPVPQVVELIRFFLFSLSGRHMGRPCTRRALWILQKHLRLMQILVQFDIFSLKQCSRHWERKRISDLTALCSSECCSLETLQWHCSRPLHLSMYVLPHEEH